MSNMEIASKVAELRELKRMSEELQAEIDGVQDAIKAHMNALGTDELSGIDYKITWKPVTTTRLDAKALTKALPDIAERFTKTSTTRRFCVA